MSIDNSKDTNEPRRPSREEIETLCILHAVAANNAATFSDLADALGLSRDLAAAVERALEPLVARDLLAVHDGLVRSTPTGEGWLLRRLVELGVA
jgi:predicted ArsR family transcriptional regulator